ncbi:MAG: dephospho-CoA kinase [Gemmatimonadota bacterium]|nr:dephospho-CoA kinase [Gemmatimonadota bacterium]MDH3422668.1 dephospho-CoA kinase [Gemmatimonadota bacterium]
MLNVALTGNVGSGKSTVAALWANAGVPVISADELARQAVLPGTPGLQDVRAAFGESVLAPDGSLDRAGLRELVFADEERRRTLEGLLHPRIRALRADWVEEMRAEGATLVVSEIPLLFETGAQADFDVTVLVDASPALRLERLQRDRGLQNEEANRIMAAQMDSAGKRSAADIVIDNSGTLQQLEATAQTALQQLRALAGQRGGKELIRVDLHLHTHGSWDCLSDPEAVLARARSLGYARIAITDHNRLAVAAEMASRYPDSVIPGEEVKTAEGVDVIGLYLTEEIPKGTSARDTIQRIRDQGGIPYLPHPFAGGKGGGGRLAGELAPLCDVIEGFNARLHTPSHNARAVELAAEHGKSVGAGSDAHTLGEVGNAFVELPAHANTADALRLALQGPSRIGGTTAPRWVHLASTWAKARKSGPGG